MTTKYKCESPSEDHYIFEDERFCPSKGSISCYENWQPSKEDKILIMQLIAHRRRVLDEHVVSFKGRLDLTNVYKMEKKLKLFRKIVYLSELFEKIDETDPIAGSSLLFDD